MYSTKHNKLQECVCVNRVELVFEVVFEGCEACDGVWAHVGLGPCVLLYLMPSRKILDQEHVAQTATFHAPLEEKHM